VLYEAAMDNLATLLAEANEVRRGLPRYVDRDFSKLPACGVLAHRFVRVLCESCEDELLVVVWRKSRGVCLSGDACERRRQPCTCWRGCCRTFPTVDPVLSARGAEGFLKDRGYSLTPSPSSCGEFALQC
jgi:hypothetical protein